MRPCASNAAQSSPANQGCRLMSSAPPDCTPRRSTGRRTSRRRSRSCSSWGRGARGGFVCVVFEELCVVWGVQYFGCARLCPGGVQFRNGVQQLLGLFSDVIWHHQFAPPSLHPPSTLSPPNQTNPQATRPRSPAPARATQPFARGPPLVSRTGLKCAGHLNAAATIWRYISMRSSL